MIDITKIIIIIITVIKKNVILEPHTFDIVPIKINNNIVIQKIIVMYYLILF